MQRYETIYLSVRELTDPAQRAAYLAQACGEDAELRQRVEEMLAEAEAATGEQRGRGERLKRHRGTQPACRKGI